MTGLWQQLSLVFSLNYVVVKKKDYEVTESLQGLRNVIFLRSISFPVNSSIMLKGDILSLVIIGSIMAENGILCRH